MKKFLCVILAIFMLVGLCGCFGSNDAEDLRGDIVTADPNQDEKEPEFALGKSANNTYSNDFLGIGCTLPAEWTFYSDEQILEMNNIVEGLVDEEVADILENATIIYDMCAVDPATGNNINVNMEKLSAVQIVSLNIKQTLEAQIDSIKSVYQNIGYTDIAVEYQKVTVDGKEFDGLKMTAKLQGVDFYSIIFTFRRSNYLANVTICAVGTDETGAILSQFTVK